jgi:hypothetical protein
VCGPSHDELIRSSVRVNNAQILRLLRRTNREQLPAWLSERRECLQEFVIWGTQCDMVPIGDYRAFRISFDGESLDPRRRRFWWDVAQRWQKHLLDESGAQENVRNDAYVHQNPSMG